MSQETDDDQPSSQETDDQPSSQESMDCIIDIDESDHNVGSEYLSSHQRPHSQRRSCSPLPSPPGSKFVDEDADGLATEDMSMPTLNDTFEEVNDYQVPPITPAAERRTANAAHPQNYRESGKKTRSKPQTQADLIKEQERRERDFDLHHVGPGSQPRPKCLVGDDRAAVPFGTLLDKAVVKEDEGRSRNGVHFTPSSRVPKTSV